MKVYFNSRLNVLGLNIERTNLLRIDLTNEFMVLTNEWTFIGEL